MNKADLIDKIAAGCDVSKSQAATAIDTTWRALRHPYARGSGSVDWFGTFSVSSRKARNGRNPQTGATIKIAAAKSPSLPLVRTEEGVNRGK